MKFYLATDDEATKARFKKRYGTRVVCAAGSATRATLRGMQDAAAEMFILASTDRILGSYYSSFSEAAALLGNRPFKQLTLPK